MPRAILLKRRELDSEVQGWLDGRVGLGDRIALVDPGVGKC